MLLMVATKIKEKEETTHRPPVEVKKINLCFKIYQLPFENKKSLFCCTALEMHSTSGSTNYESNLILNGQGTYFGCVLLLTLHEFGRETRG